MNLDENQKKQVAAWIEEGLKMAEIQIRLEKELGLKMTYMEVRFLIDDLSLKPKDPDTPEEPEDQTEESTPSPDATPSASQDAAPTPDQEMESPGDVTVSVDQVTRPGALVSGRVTFSDGKGGAWYLDQTGRLGIATDEEGYKPSQADIMVFQGELQSALAKLGF